MPFTTYDRDNDNGQNDINCASRFSGGKDRYILTKILKSYVIVQNESDLVIFSMICIKVGGTTIVDSLISMA